MIPENRENVKTSDLLESGYQEVKVWIDSTDEPELSMLKECQVLIVGFMISAAIVYAANKIVEAIDQKD